ncbi:MAG: class I adenylate-forming enzyme family protein [Bacteriovorax sp.]|jgi:acyl-CoA synthetase (AMP-forming)/AMP-acid ligase II
MESSLLNRLLLNAEKFSSDIFIFEAETGQGFTYDNFLQDSRRGCHFLIENFKDSDIVVLLGNNSYLYAVYAMAAILSGKTLFPLNPGEDCKILSKTLSKLSKKYVIFSDEEYSFPFENIYLIQDLGNIVVPKNFRLIDPLPCRDLIYIATSATTGEPKIVIQKEEALMANVNALIEHHRLFERKKIATPLPMFHVNALHFAFFSTLFSGGQLVLFRFFDPRKCFELIERIKVDILSIIPTLLTNLIHNYEILKTHDISSLKYFVSAAAPLSTETVKDIRKLFGKKIIQGYGLSEAINFSCTLPIDIDDSTYEEVMCREKFPSVGISLECNEVVVFANDFSKAGSGEEGEFAIRGTNLMAGYLNTVMESFFHKDYFLSGDLGYFKTYKSKKYFFISGRKKEIAKVSGETVSLRELDELLRQDNYIGSDFFSVSFNNIYKGEEIGIVCRLESNYKVQQLAEKLINQFNNIKSNRRPKVILFVRNLNIRTPSGKAKRFFFSEHFEEFSEKRFLNQTLYKII